MEESHERAKAGIRWGRVFEKGWTEIGRIQEETKTKVMSTGECGGCKTNVRDTIQVSGKTSAKTKSGWRKAPEDTRGSKDRMGMKRYERDRMGMKRYLHGPMDCSRKLKE